MTVEAIYQILYIYAPDGTRTVNRRRVTQWVERPRITWWNINNDDVPSPTLAERAEQFMDAFYGRYEDTK